MKLTPLLKFVSSFDVLTVDNNCITGTGEMVKTPRKRGKEQGKERERGKEETVTDRDTDRHRFIDILIKSQ